MADPRILLLDLETFPNLIWTWGYYDQSAIAVKRDWIICGFSVKWLGGKQLTKGLPDYPGYSPSKIDDSKLVDEVWALMDEADIIVAHNGDDFDIKKLNTRFLVNDLPPVSPYKTVDTKKAARKIFGFSSNKLNELARQLGVGEKMSTGGFELWEGCMAGEPAAWAKMKRYNAHDVKLLEGIYLKMRPWIPHPNYGLFKQITCCPKCGSEKLQPRGTAVNITSIAKRFRCADCGGWSRSTKKASVTSVVNA